MRPDSPIAENKNKVYKYTQHTFLACSLAASFSMVSALPLLGGFTPLFLMLPSLFLLNYYSVNKEEDAAYYALLAFGVAMGLSLGPVLNLIILTVPGGVGLVAIALLTTWVQTAALKAYAKSRNQNDTEMAELGAFASTALSGLCLVGLIGCMVPFSSLGMMAYAASGVLVFSLLLTYDFWRIENQSDVYPAVMAAGLFLDVVNLFLCLLQVEILSSSYTSSSYKP